MKLKKNDLFMGIYILSAVLFFIISIPSWLLDILLAFNIMVALIILFNSLYAKEVLDMAAFPTMLLFTTIFRISLLRLESLSVAAILLLVRLFLLFLLLYSL